MYPRLIVEGIPLTSDSVLAPLPDPLLVQAVSEIPNQVRVEVGTLSFTNQGVSADLVISNLGVKQVALGSLPTLLADDQETRYPLVAPTDNPQLVLDAGTTLEGTFAFSGRISDAAVQIMLLFNAGGWLPIPGLPH